MMGALVLCGGLFLIALCRGFQVLYVCSSREKTITCDTGILIHSARYGRFDPVRCPHYNIYEVGCGVDVEEDVRSKCHNQTTCRLLASKFVYGNPCVGTYKYLEVNYTCDEHPYGSVDTATNFEYREVKNTLEQNHAGSLLMTSTAHSQTECAIECSATLCISFSYNILTRECKLYGAEICHRDDGVTSTDVKVFTKIIQADSDALINNNGTLC